MQLDDVLGQHLVLDGVQRVSHQEDAVEARENARLEVDLVGYLGQVVLPTVVGVGCGQDAGPSVEQSGDAGLSDRNGLLLHGLVDGYSVLRTHLIELVDTHRSAITQH